MTDDKLADLLERNKRYVAEYILPSYWDQIIAALRGRAEREWLANALEHIAGSCEGHAAEIARAALAKHKESKT